MRSTEAERVKRLYKCLETIDFNIGKFELAGPEERPESRLLATLELYGVPHHFELIEVTQDADGIQTPVYEQFAGWGCGSLDHLAAFDGGDGSYQEIILDSKRYIAVMTPFRD